MVWVFLAARGHDDFRDDGEVAGVAAAVSPSRTAGIVASCRNRFEPNGMTSRPSAVWAVALVNRGPSAPT